LGGQSGTVRKVYREIDKFLKGFEILKEDCEIIEAGFSLSLNEMNSKSFGNATDFSRIYREILMSILKLTVKGPVSKALVSRDARVPFQVTAEALGKFFDDGLIRLSDKAVEASLSQRVRIAIRVLEFGADFEKVCGFLSWQEFESIAAMAFEASNFMVERRFRFTWANRRWEIDVLGCKEPMIVCVDCKHWHHGWGRSAITKAVEAQIERTKALTETLQSTHVMPKKLGLTSWKKGILIPLVLSLVPGPFKFYKKTPIVPILQLQNFLSELPAYADTLMCFRWEKL
jgi:Holliday junction resolvase-like predicted endonuclease